MILLKRQKGKITTRTALAAGTTMKVTTTNLTQVVRTTNLKKRRNM